MRPKGTALELEARRKFAAALLKDGKSIAETARLTGAHVSSVKRWKKVLETEGEQGLKPKPQPGRAPRLSSNQKQRLVKILLRGAVAAGYKTELWTLRRVAEVIQRQWGERFHPGHVWKILRSLNFSPQKPERRARERDEDAIANWRRVEWPRIKKGSPPAS